MGVYADNVITWKNNGVEYVYPDEVLRDIFGGSSDFVIQDGRVTVGDITKTKNELCEAVVGRLDSDTELPEELEAELLRRLQEAID